MTHTRRTLFDNRRWLWAALPIMAGVACGEATIPKVPEAEPEAEETSTSLTITSPAPGQHINRPVIEVIGEADGLGEVTVNGALVEVVDGSFSHFVPARKDGRKRVEVGGQNVETEVVEVIVDWEPPKLEVDTPRRGDFLRASARQWIEIEGRAWDSGSGLAQLEINGEVVEVDFEGSFEARIAPEIGVNTISIEATDRGGHLRTSTRSVLFGDFEPLENPLEDAITARIDPEGLEMIFPELIESVLPGIATDFSQRYPELAFEITALRFEGLAMSIDALEGALDIQSAASEVEVDFKMLHPPQIEGTITVEDLRLDTTMSFSADGQGNVALHTGGGTSSHGGVDIQFNGLLGVVDRFFAGTIEDLIDEVLTQVAEGYVLERALEANALVGTFEFAQSPALTSFLLREINIDPTGLHLRLAGDFQTLAEARTHATPGSLVTKGGRPPVDPDRAMFRFNFSDDLLNRALTALWVGGAMDLELGALLRDEQGAPMNVTADTLALMVGPSIFDHAEPDTPAQILISPSLPPVVRLETRGRGTLKMSLADLIVELRLKPEVGADKLCARVAVNMEVEVDIDLTDEDNPLVLTSQATADILDEPLFNIHDALFEALMGGLFERLPELIDPAALWGQAPDEGPLGVERAVLVPAGGEGHYLALFVNLFRDPNAAPRPDLEIIDTVTNNENGHTYLLLEASTWTQAHRVAAAMGGHLVTVRNDAENQWLLETFGEVGGDPRDLWIGLNDAEGEGHFAWTSGEQVDYANWSRGQPDNDTELSPLGESFVHIHGYDSRNNKDGLWNDMSDTDRAPWNEGFHGVVEIRP